MSRRISDRRSVIRQIIRSEEIRTQRKLVERLRSQGFRCTQATISRDVTEMKLTKLRSGVYVLAEDLHLHRMVSELVVDVQRADNMVIIKAQPGTASGIAAAIDAAELPEMLGTLAGNDTILVIGKTAKDGEEFEKMISKLRSEE